MDHEGMVHALEKIHRVLKPDGSLIDIHPVLEPPRIEVYRRGTVVFAEAKPDYSEEDYRQTEQALALVIQRRLYIVGGSRQFDFLIYGSSVAELRDFLEETNAYEKRVDDEDMAAREAELLSRVEEFMQTSRDGTEVAYHERARMTRLRRVK